MNITTKRIALESASCVCVTFGDMGDADTNKPLFNDTAWKKADNIFRTSSTRNWLAWYSLAASGRHRRAGWRSFWVTSPAPPPTEDRLAGHVDNF